MSSAESMNEKNLFLIIKYDDSDVYMCVCVCVCVCVCIYM